MARVPIIGIATNKDGADDKLKVIPSGTVSCYQAGTAVAINQYENEVGGSPATIYTNANGEYVFWIDVLDANKRIKVEIVKSGYTTVTIDYYQAWFLDINSLTEKTSLAGDDLFLSEDSQNLYNPKKIKASKLGGSEEYFQPVVYTPAEGNIGEFRCRDWAHTATAYASFFAPSDLSSLTKIYVVVVPTASGSGLDIDFYSDYGAIGENYNAHSESDTSSTYNLTINEVTEIDVTSIFSNLAAFDFCGLQMYNNVGNTIKLLGVQFEFDL